MGKYFPFFFLLFPAICCAGILQERGFREALTPSPSFRQSEGEVKWDKQPESELDLGKAYYYGRGTKKNFKKARKHLQKAADAGEREAQLILALMQVQGQGIAENPQAGFEAVQKLAPDYPLAQYALARLYADGLGTPANAEKALKWLTRAAQAPVPVPAAQVKLGNYYAEGYPPYIKPDAEKAFELTLAAAEAAAMYGLNQQIVLPEDSAQAQRRDGSELPSQIALTDVSEIAGVAPAAEEENEEGKSSDGSTAVPMELISGKATVLPGQDISALPEQESKITMIAAPVKFFLIKNSDEYKKFKTRARGSYPAVDFTKQMLVVLESDSQLPDNVFEIRSAQLKDGKVHVTYAVSLFDLDKKLNTHAVAAVGRSDADVELEQVL